MLTVNGMFYGCGIQLLDMFFECSGFVGLIGIKILFVIKLKFNSKAH